MATMEASEVSDIEHSGRQRRRTPAWLWFTLGGVLVPVSFVAVLFAHGYATDGDRLAYAFPILLAGAACTAIVLGFRSLPRAGGVAGRWAAMLLGTVGLAVVGAVVGIISGEFFDRETGDVILMPWLFLAVISGLAGAVWVWRGMDEAAREAHKWAWYWGGSLGIIPGFFIAIGDGGVALASRLGFDRSSDLIECGAIAVLSSMIVGYLLAWGFWWLRRR